MLVLDRHQAEAAKNYAEALAALAKGTAENAYFLAKNTILLRGVDETGKTYSIGRVLTARESVSMSRAPFTL